MLCTLIAEIYKKADNIEMITDEKAAEIFELFPTSDVVAPPHKTSKISNEDRSLGCGPFCFKNIKNAM